MAGRIPREFINDLLARTDIVEVIDARVPLKKAGKDYKACCPFHEEKTPSFTVSPDKQFYHCFGCGAHGTAIGFLMEYDRMEFLEAVEELAARAGLQVPRESGFLPQKDSGAADLLPILEEAARFYRAQLRSHPSAPQAIEYLKGRGVSGEVAREFGVGYAPEGWDNLTRALGTDEAARERLVAAGLAVKKEGGGYYDRFRNRIVFPIHDHRGRIVGFGGRVLVKEEPKYLNSPETALFHKGRELYGLFRARDAIKRDNRVLVVEGYMDVVALAQHGINNAVATLGTAATPEHLKQLFRHAPEVVFCFDGDRAGREAAWRALDVVLPLLYEGRQASFLFLPEGEDPDTLVRKEGREAFLARLHHAKPLPDLLFDTLAQQVDLGRLDGRARLVELARPYLSKIPPGALRELMLGRLQDLSQVPGGKLTTLALDGGERPVAQSGARYAPHLNPRQPPSVMRLAVAMLVQHPDLAAKAPSAQQFEGLDEPGAALFLELLEWLQVHSARNTAAIAEHFRGREEENQVARLAMWDHPALGHDVEAEFLGTLAKLQQKAVKQRTARLLQKEKLSGLTAEEKLELARLLTLRSTGFDPSLDRH
jgi:DNA primase